MDSQQTFVNTRLFRNIWQQQESSVRRATIKEIAERVGVGTAAVSVVLNGARSGTRVSEQTRTAILNTARELNYQPNALAQSLRMQRTGIIGYFSGYECIDPRNPYIAEVMSGLQAACTSKAIDLLLYTPHQDLAPEHVVANLSNGRLDGLVMTARPEHPITKLLVQAHLPVVAIADPIPEVPSVVADSYEGGRLQARHLFERGHRRVMYLPADYPFLSVLDRYLGFREQAAELGITVVDGRPIHGSHPELGPIEAGLHNYMPAEDLARLRGSDRVTAIVVWDDSPAYRIATQLAEEGFRIPEDVAVMGYNGCACAVEPRWKLSAVRAPWRTVAENALDTLLACIRGEQQPALTVLPVDLTIGTTT
jgi:DNA-binding LacI/PurR family transcriptional regulator